MKTKRLLAMLIAVVVLAGFATACSQTGTPAGTDPVPSSTVSGTETDVVTEPVDTGPGLDPDRKFDGYSYVILQHSGAAGKDFEAEEDSSDVLLSADYARKLKVEDALGIEIIVEELTAGKRDGAAVLNNYMVAGDYVYSLASLSSYSAGNAMLSNLLTDLNSIPNLDLSRGWWDQSCVVDCTVGEKLYFMTGDISYIDNNQTFAMQFNKKLANDYGLPSLYEYVDNKTWTLDTLLQVVRKAAAVDGDVDKDGQHQNDPDDIYPVYTWDDAVLGFINASDVKCAGISDSGEFEFTLNKNQDKLFSVFDKYSSILYDTDLTCAYQRNGYDKSYGLIAFRDDRALFYFSNIWICTLLRNDMESEYGVLPFPMYDESQTKYISPIAPFNMMYYVVPSNGSEEDLDAIGFITQLLGYESKRLVTPAYYDKILKQRSTSDEDSHRMVDLILASRAHDFGWIYELGGYNEGLMNLFRTYSSDLSSTISATLEQAQSKINDLNLAIKG